MKYWSCLAFALAAGSIAFARAETSAKPGASKSAKASVQKDGLPSLSLQKSTQPLKEQLDRLGLQVTTPAAAPPSTPSAAAQVPDTITLGAQTTSSFGAFAFARNVRLWAAGALPIQGVEPNIWYEKKNGSFFILYPLVGTRGKHITFDCKGAFSSAMTVGVLAISTTQLFGWGSGAFPTTENKTKVGVIVDPSRYQTGASWLLFGLANAVPDVDWGLTSCTVEKK